MQDFILVGAVGFQGAQYLRSGNDVNILGDAVLQSPRKRLAEEENPQFLTQVVAFGFF